MKTNFGKGTFFARLLAGKSLLLNRCETAQEHRSCALPDLVLHNGRLGHNTVATLFIG